MGKNIVSIKMSGMLANDIIDQEIRSLCDSKSISFEDFYQEVGPISVNNINLALEHNFPGELKILE